MLLRASALLIAFTAPLAAQVQRTPEAELRAIDSTWARNYATNDTATAMRLMADDFFMTSSNGRTKDRATEMGDIRATPGSRVNYFRTSQVRVTVHATCAVVTGLAEWSFVMNGSTSNSSREYIAVYTRGGPLGWQLAVLNMKPVGAGTTGQAAIRAEADSLMRTMVAAFKRAPASVARYYTDDARMVGGGMATVGRQQIDTYWAQATGFADWTLQVHAAGGEPNTPWVIGRSVLKTQSGRDMVTEFVGVLQRGTDGQLRFRIDKYAAAR